MLSLQPTFSKQLSLQIITVICIALISNSCSLIDSDSAPKPTILTGVTLSAADFQRLRDNHRPLKSFDETPPPQAPDYTSEESWAALWPRADEADVAPPNTAYPEAQSSAQVDVFFVHPTCYTKKDFWNGPVDDPDVKSTVSFMMKYMAGVFNSTARVYAPRYRQFTLFSVVETRRHQGCKPLNWLIRMWSVLLTTT